MFCDFYNHKRCNMSHQHVSIGQSQKPRNNSRNVIPIPDNVPSDNMIDIDPLHDMRVVIFRF